MSFLTPHYTIFPEEDFSVSPLSVVGELIQVPDASRLEKAKASLSYWFRIGEAALFQAAEIVAEIERDALFRFELNPDTSQPFRSMSEFYPYLVTELKASSHLHSLSEKLMREVIRLDKVFVQNLGVPRQQILDDGISRYTMVAEALDYDRKTGVVSESPKEGKLGKEEALQILQKSVDDGWRLQDLQSELDERRGVKRRTVRIDWMKESGRPMYSIGRIIVTDGNVSYDSSDEGLPIELARWLTKRLGAMSNLPQEESI